MIQKRQKGRPTQQTVRVCIQCSKAKIDSQFYVITKSLVHPDGLMPICRDCTKKALDPSDIRTFIDLLKLCDKAYIPAIWEKAKVKGHNAFSTYLNAIRHSDYDKLTFIQSPASDMDEAVQTAAKEASKKMLKESTPPELIQKWGENYTIEEIKKLETFYQEMVTSYEIETASHKDYTKKICMVSLKMEQELNSNNINEFSKLSSVYDKLMTSAKFTAAQRSPADRAGGMNTFSEFFAFVEKDGFIPRFHSDEPHDVVDSTIKNYENYVKNLLVGDSNILTLLESYLDRLNTKEMEEDELLGMDAQELASEDQNEAFGSFGGDLVDG